MVATSWLILVVLTAVATPTRAGCVGREASYEHQCETLHTKAQCEQQFVCAWKGSGERDCCTGDCECGCAGGCYDCSTNCCPYVGPKCPMAAESDVVWPEQSEDVVLLSDGVSMPALAFGANVWDSPTCKQATAAAIAAGFRFVWSSMLVGAECQAAQAEAIAASGLARSALFLAGTVNTGSCADHASCYAATKSGADGQFAALNVTKLDMLMLDYPSSAGCDGITGQWRAFTELHSAGRVRTIAVSNFDEGDLKCVAEGKQTQPTVNQLSFSVGTPTEVVATNAKYGVVVQAYSPLGSGGLASDPQLQAIGAQHNRTAAQVALRWIIQHNATINTQSTNPAHLREDAAIFDFVLSDSEMAQLDARHS